MQVLVNLDCVLNTNQCFIKFLKFIKTTFVYMLWINAWLKLNLTDCCVMIKERKTSKHS